MTAPAEIDAAAMAAIAKGLTKAAIRALVRSGDSPDVLESSDAYSLWWGKSGGKGLTSPPRWFGDRYHLSLTPLGLLVRAYLQSERSSNAG